MPRKREKKTAEIVNKPPSRPSPEAQKILRALRRAGKRALELGMRTGTPVYVMRNNQIVDLTKDPAVIKKWRSSKLRIKVEPLGSEYCFEGKESDIVEVFCTRSGLRLVVSTWLDSINETLLEVYFRDVRAYRYLDEGDLLGYWETGRFRSPHHVYEITKGGWLAEEQPGLLEVTKAMHGYREWFIATTNGCMTVLASVPPELRDLKH